MSYLPHYVYLPCCISPHLVRLSLSLTFSITTFTHLCRFPDILYTRLCLVGVRYLTHGCDGGRLPNSRSWRPSSHTDSPPLLNHPPITFFLVVILTLFLSSPLPSPKYHLHSHSRIGVLLCATLSKDPKFHLELYLSIATELKCVSQVT